jgi:hypothetical protein
VPSYTVFKSTNNKDFDVVESDVITPYLEVTGLLFGEVYYFRVRQELPDADTEKTTSDSFRIKLLGPPDPPANLTELSQGRSRESIILDWEEPAWLGGNTNITYTIFLSKNFTDESEEVTLFENVIDTQLTVQNLTPGLSYQYKLQTVAGILKSSITEIRTVTFLARPSAPTGLTEVTEERTESSMLLKWTESDFFGGVSKVTYTVLAASGD